MAPNMTLPLSEVTSTLIIPCNVSPLRIACSITVYADTHIHATRWHQHHLRPSNNLVHSICPYSSSGSRSAADSRRSRRPRQEHK